MGRTHHQQRRDGEVEAVDGVCAQFERSLHIAQARLMARDGFFKTSANKSTIIGARQRQAGKVVQAVCHDRASAFGIPLQQLFRDHGARVEERFQIARDRVLQVLDRQARYRAAGGAVDWHIHQPVKQSRRKTLHRYPIKQSVDYAVLLADRSQPPEVLPPEPPPTFCWVYFHFTFEYLIATSSVRMLPCLTVGATLLIRTFSSSISKYLIRSPLPSARRNSSFALGMVLPDEQVCSSRGVARSASFETTMSLCSVRSAVWPPPVDAVADLGCSTSH